MTEGDPRSQAWLRLQLLREVLPIFIHALTKTSQTDDKILVIGMLNACRTQLEGINFPIVPRDLNQHTLQHALKCSEILHKTLGLLEGLLEGDIFEGNILLHQMEYPKLASIQCLKNIWATDKLAHYVNFGSTSNLRETMLQLVPGIYSVIASTGEFSPASVESSQVGAEQDETLEATLLQEAKIAQNFCESATTLFKCISERINCHMEHKLRVHLSGFGRQNQDIKMLFHNCVESSICPGAYPVHFSNQAPFSSPSTTISQICLHIQRARILNDPVRIYFNKDEFRVAGKGKVSDISPEDIILSFDNLFELFAPKSASNNFVNRDLGNSFRFSEAHRRRLQCLLAQSLMYLYYSPWITDMCDPNNLSVPSPGIDGSLEKSYSLCNLRPAKNMENDAIKEVDDKLELRTFMAKFGLMLLRIQFQQCLELTDQEESLKELGYEVALRRYIKQLNVELDSPLSIRKAVYACRDFPEIVEETCSPLLTDEKIKCRLTILKKILDPLTTDLLDNYDSVALGCPHLLTMRTLEEAVKGIRESLEYAFSEINSRKKGTVHPVGGTFIPRHELRSAWDKIGLQEFFQIRGIHLEDRDRDKIKNEYLTLLSTLLEIKWNEWWRFCDLSLEDNDGLFKDDKLPIRDKRVLERFFDSQDASLFWKTQHDYVHAMLPNRDCDRLLPNQSLPYLKDRQEKLGRRYRGDECGVYHEVIPPFCMELRNGSTNTADFHVARKVVNDYTMANEKRAAILFKTSITQHEGIVEILSLYQRDGFLDIVYPLALSDLEVFMMEEKYAQLWTDSLTMATLMVLIRTLASGLKFLHFGTEDRFRRSSILYHMDFRPKNILVYHGKDKHARGKLELKICDFGIAAIQVKPAKILPLLVFGESSSVRAPATSPEAKATRGAGTYQAPEMHYDPNHVGQNSDVWSLAAIIITLIIRKVSGKDGVVEFANGRVDENKKEDFFFSDKSNEAIVLNEEVDRWLSQLSDESSDLSKSIVKQLLMSSSGTVNALKNVRGLPQKLSGILRKALEIRTEDRISSEELHNALEELWY